MVSAVRQRAPAGRDRLLRSMQGRDEALLSLSTIGMADCRRNGRPRQPVRRLERSPPWGGETAARRLPDERPGGCRSGRGVRQVGQGMKIGIHNEPAAASLGGSECMVAMIAAALGDAHDVEIVHHHLGLTLSTLAAFSGASLDRVKLRYFDRKRPASSLTRLPWRMYAESRDFCAELSSPYDVFISVTHGIPPFCHAPVGVLFVLFPIGNRAETWPIAGQGDAGALRRLLRVRYHDWEWSRRMGSFQTKLAISEFTSRWTRAYWDIDCEVLYPPVDTDFAV